MSAVHHILLVDDDQTLRDTLSEQLSLYEEFRLSTADTATAAIKAVQGDTGHARFVGLVDGPNADVFLEGPRLARFMGALAALVDPAVLKPD